MSSAASSSLPYAPAASTSLTLMTTCVGAGAPGGLQHSTFCSQASVAAAHMMLEEHYALAFSCHAHSTPSLLCTVRGT